MDYTDYTDPWRRRIGAEKTTEKKRLPCGTSPGPRFARDTRYANSRIQARGTHGRACICELAYRAAPAEGRRWRCAAPQPSSSSFAPWREIVFSARPRDPHTTPESLDNRADRVLSHETRHQSGAAC